MLKLLRHQEIISVLKTPACHASTLLPLDDGRVLAAWFGGSHEGNTDVGIWMSEKTEAGFSEPCVVAQGLEPHWNPVLFQRLNGEILLFYKVGHPIADWRTYLISSKDGGKTWSDPRELVSGDVSGGRGPVRNKPIRLKSGRVVAPASVERGLWRCFMDLSDDDGQSWRRTALIEAKGTGELAQGIQYWQDERAKAEKEGTVFNGSLIPAAFQHGRGIIQPTLWEDDSGVHALMRSGEGRIYRSDSTDQAETWCEAYPTALPNNNSGIDLTRLDDGTLILAYNPCEGNFTARTPLSMAVSTDGGASFTKECDLETAPGEYSYPAIVHVGERIYLSYTNKRQNISYWEFEWVK